MKLSFYCYNKQKTRQILICLCLFFILLIPNIYAAFRATDLVYSPIKAIAYIFVSAFFLLLPAIFLKKRALFIVEGFLVLIPAPIEIASLYLYRMPTTQTFLKVILDTNLREATEVMSSLILPLIALLTLWTLYIILLLRLDNDYLLPKTWRLSLLLTIPVVFLLGVSSMYLLDRKTADRSGTAALRLATEKVLMKGRKIFPTDTYIVLTDNIRQERDIAQWNRQLQDFSFSISEPQDSIDLLVCLVIGEAARASSFSLNGYERETNPCLSRQQNLISFPHAYSLTNITESSVPLMLTRATRSNMSIAYQEKSVVEAFQEAGFTTSWLTNKTPFPYTSRIIAETDFSFVNGRSSDADNNYDTLLWRPFSEFLHYQGDSDTQAIRKQMVVVHHTGSHFKYTLRYPPAFEVFTPTFSKTEGYQVIRPENKERLRNAYDNTLLFTDYFLSGLIDSIRATQRPAVLLYMSDHGENLYDDDRQLVLHCTYAGSDEEFHVPLFVWYSDAYAAIYPDKVKALRKNKENMVSSDVLFHTLIDISELKTPLLDKHYSLCSDMLLNQDSIACLTASGAEYVIKLRIKH